MHVHIFGLPIQAALRVSTHVQSSAVRCAHPFCVSRLSHRQWPAGAGDWVCAGLRGSGRRPSESGCRKRRCSAQGQQVPPAELRLRMLKCLGVPSFGTCKNHQDWRERSVIVVGPPGCTSITL